FGKSEDQRAAVFVKEIYPPGQMHGRRRFSSRFETQKPLQFVRSFSVELGSQAGLFKSQGGELQKGVIAVNPFLKKRQNWRDWARHFPAGPSIVQGRPHLPRLRPQCPVDAPVLSPQIVLSTLNVCP